MSSNRCSSLHFQKLSELLCLYSRSPSSMNDFFISFIELNDTRQSFYWFILKLNDIFLWNLETFKLAYFLYLYLLHQCLLSLPVLLEFLIFNALHFFGLLNILFSINYLLLYFIGMLFEELFSFTLEFWFNFFQLLLLSNSWLKLCFLSPGLFL